MADTPTSGYAWTTIYLGGEYIEARDGRRVVVSRDTIEPGAKVTKSGLKVNDNGEKRAVTDEEWDSWVEGGSIRTYPMPKMPEGYSGSPSEYVLSQLRKGGEDFDTDTLLGLTLAHPEFELPPEEEAKKK